jgi:hypothetical protein
MQEVPEISDGEAIDLVATPDPGADPAADSAAETPVVIAPVSDELAANGDTLRGEIGSSSCSSSPVMVDPGDGRSCDAFRIQCGHGR